MRQTHKEYIEDFMSEKRGFAMFSAKGDRRVQALVKKCMKKILSDKRITKEEYEEYVSNEASKVVNIKEYREMGDTAVRECIYSWLEDAIERADYEWANDFMYELTYID